MSPRIAALVLIAVAAQPAAAQLFVNDPAVVLGQAKSLLQEVKSYGTQIQQYGTQLEQARYELAQLQGFIHDPSLGGAAGLLNQTGLSNSLPVNPSAAAALASGYGSLTSLSGVLGRLSQLNGLVNTNFNANHVYTCTDTSASCAALNANAQSIAGMQGAAQAAHQDLRNHLPVIQALRERLLDGDHAERRDGRPGAAADRAALDAKPAKRTGGDRDELQRATACARAARQ